MAINQTQRKFLNERMGQVPFLTKLGDQIYAMQLGLVGGQTDPYTGTEVPLEIGFDAASLPNFTTTTATATIATAGTAVACAAVTWPQTPKVWSVIGPVGACVTEMTYASGQATFTVNASAAGTVTVYFA